VAAREYEVSCTRENEENPGDLSTWTSEFLVLAPSFWLDLGVRKKMPKFLGGTGGGGSGEKQEMLTLRNCKGLSFTSGIPV